MAKILNIETTSICCSVSIGVEGKLHALCESFEPRTHSSKINLLVEKVLQDAGIEKIEELDAISVSKGPGSYTGLRIGVSSAKGFAYSIDAPLIGIGTLKSLAFSGLQNVINNIPDFLKNKTDFLFCPMIDARRMEVYAAIYDNSLNEVRQVNADIIDDKSYAEFLKRNKVVFFGTGSEKCKPILNNNQNAIFLDGIYPSSKDMVVLSEESFQNKTFEDVAYFEPYYLKDFIAGVKK